MRVVLTDHEFSSLGIEHATAREVGAEFSVHQARAESDVAAVTEGADVVMLCHAQITRRVLENLAPGATVIRYGIGYETIDVAAATDLGVRVCNVPDYGADTVADHTVMMALAVLRRAHDYHRAMADSEHGWIAAPEIGQIPAMSDVVYGLVGIGQIGRKVARRVQAFGSRVIAYDPYADPSELADEEIELCSLDELSESADVVSIHAPLTADTFHIIGTEQIAKMKQSTVIVNTARGALLDTEAAAAAVTEGRLAGLGLDVFETEPLEAGHSLRSTPRTLLSPHAAFYSIRSLENLHLFAAEEMGRACRGEPLRCQVNQQDSPTRLAANNTGC